MAQSWCDGGRTRRPLNAPPTRSALGVTGTLITSFSINSDPVSAAERGSTGERSSGRPSLPLIIRERRPRRTTASSRPHAAKRSGHAFPSGHNSKGPIMYVTRFSYDVLPVNRQQALDFIRREALAAQKSGLNARMLVPLTRGHGGGAALLFEVELASLDQLDQFSQPRRRIIRRHATLDARLQKGSNFAALRGNSASRRADVRPTERLMRSAIVNETGALGRISFSSARKKHWVPVIGAALGAN